MAEADVISLLRDKRSELAGIMVQLEHQLVRHRAGITHLDAAILLFGPDIRLEEIHPRQPRARSIWFGRNECLRLI